MCHIVIQPFDGWYEDIIVDFCEDILPSFGLSVSYKDVEFSGFWSQGDGASFTGNFFLCDVNPTELKASLPTEVDLHQLIDQLAELAEAHHEIQGTVTRMSSHYSHSNTMNIGDYSSNKGYCNEETEAFASDAEDNLLSIFRQLADWLYNSLSENYDFYLADATASQWAEAIEERKALQADLDQLQVDIVENTPQSQIQAEALTTAIAALDVEIEALTSTIDQLADQFRYWPKENGPFTIEQFYEDNF